MRGTLGVGGSPLLVAFGGEVARFCELVLSLSSMLLKQNKSATCFHTIPTENTFEKDRPSPGRSSWRRMTIAMTAAATRLMGPRIC